MDQDSSDSLLHSLHEEEAQQDMGFSDDESLMTRVKRVINPRRMFQWSEISGAFGDLGTFLPDVIALARIGAHPSPAAFVFFSGFWNLVTGCVFDIPLAIQPMHTIGDPFICIVATEIHIYNFPTIQSFS